MGCKGSKATQPAAVAPPAPATTLLEQKPAEGQADAVPKVPGEPVAPAPAAAATSPVATEPAAEPPADATAEPAAEVPTSPAAAAQEDAKVPSVPATEPTPAAGTTAEEVVSPKEVPTAGHEVLETVVEEQVEKEAPTGSAPKSELRLEGMEAVTEALEVKVLEAEKPAEGRFLCCY